MDISTNRGMHVHTRTQKTAQVKQISFVHANWLMVYIFLGSVIGVKVSPLLWAVVISRKIY